MSNGNPLLTVQVKDVKINQPLSNFRFIVNENNVGNPFDPDPDNWPSLKPGASHSPVIAVGDSSAPTVAVPEGSYLVSVLAPGYKLGGQHISISADLTVTIGP